MVTIQSELRAAVAGTCTQRVTNTSWSIAIFQQLIIADLVKFPVFCGIKRFATVFTETSHLCSE